MGDAAALGAVERELVASSPLIADARAVGDGRPYVTALVALDAGAAIAFASEHGLPDERPGALAEDAQLRGIVADAVARSNCALPEDLRVRRFTILPAGERPREPLLEHHAGEIEAMYL